MRGGYLYLIDGRRIMHGWLAGLSLMHPAKAAPSCSVKDLWWSNDMAQGTCNIRVKVQKFNGARNVQRWQDLQRLRCQALHDHVKRMTQPNKVCSCRYSAEQWAVAHNNLVVMIMYKRRSLRYSTKSSLMPRSNQSTQTPNPLCNYAMRLMPANAAEITVTAKFKIRRSPSQQVVLKLEGSAVGETKYHYRSSARILAMRARRLGMRIRESGR